MAKTYAVALCSAYEMHYMLLEPCRFFIVVVCRAYAQRGIVSTGDRHAEE